MQRTLHPIPSRYCFHLLNQRLSARKHPEPLATAQHHSCSAVRTVPRDPSQGKLHAPLRPRRYYCSPCPRPHLRSPRPPLSAAPYIAPSAHSVAPQRASPTTQRTVCTPRGSRHRGDEQCMRGNRAGSLGWTNRVARRSRWCHMRHCMRGKRRMWGSGERGE